MIDRITLFTDLMEQYKSLDKAKQFDLTRAFHESDEHEIDRIPKPVNKQKGAQSFFPLSKLFILIQYLPDQVKSSVSRVLDNNLQPDQVVVFPKLVMQYLLKIVIDQVVIEESWYLSSDDGHRISSLDEKLHIIKQINGYSGQKIQSLINSPNRNIEYIIGKYTSLFINKFFFCSDD